MQIHIEINDQLVRELASFQGKEFLTAEELGYMVHKTIVDKASEFVRLSADRKMAEANSAINQAAAIRQEEISNGIVVTV